MPRKSIFRRNKNKVEKKIEEPSLQSTAEASALTIDSSLFSFGQLGDANDFAITANTNDFVPDIEYRYSLSYATSVGLALKGLD